MNVENIFLSGNMGQEALGALSAMPKLKNICINWSADQFDFSSITSWKNSSRLEGFFLRCFGIKNNFQEEEHITTFASLKHLVLSNTSLLPQSLSCLLQPACLESVYLEGLWNFHSLNTIQVSPALKHLFIENMEENSDLEGQFLDELLNGLQHATFVKQLETLSIQCQYFTFEKLSQLPTTPKKLIIAGMYDPQTFAHIEQFKQQRPQQQIELLQRSQMNVRRILPAVKSIVDSFTAAGYE